MIYDCFPFFNELDVLEIRLNVLDPVVDFFVIVESTMTFQKTLKPLYFENNKSRFQQFLPKIIHIIDDQMPLDKDTWITYRHQLNCIHQALRDAADNDIISISDLDEIPNPELLQDFNYQGLIHPAQQVYYYFLNCATSNDKWDSGFITPYRIIKGQDIHDARMRVLIQGEHVPNGGWHFSYMGGIESIMEKLSSFSHVEYNTPEFINKEFILQHIKNRTSLFDSGKLHIVPIDKSFPKYIQDNVLKYVAMGWII